MKGLDRLCKDVTYIRRRFSSSDPPFIGLINGFRNELYLLVELLSYWRFVVLCDSCGLSCLLFVRGFARVVSGVVRARGGASGFRISRVVGLE
jgi:hypothetical protein